MLQGVVPFPPEFAQRYRERGYWQDKSLAEEFRPVFARNNGRVAIIDRDRSITYTELDQLSDNLALNLLHAGLKPLDRVVVQLPNVAEFVILYFALQKIGAIPITALAAHRHSEIRQFAELSGATACVFPERQRDFDYAAMVSRIRQEVPAVKLGIILGAARDGFLSLTEMISTPAPLPLSALAAIKIDPEDPAVFQLSGGTTGIPKLIPRSHNDYAYNSKIAADVCAVTAGFDAAAGPAHRAQPAAGLPWDSGLLLERRQSGHRRQHQARGYVRADREASRHARESGSRAAHSPAQRSVSSALRSIVAADYSERRAKSAAGDAPADQPAHPQRVRAGEFRHGRGAHHVCPHRRSRGGSPGHRRPAGVAR